MLLDILWIFSLGVVIGLCIPYFDPMANQIVFGGLHALYLLRKRQS